MVATAKSAYSHKIIAANGWKLPAGSVINNILKFVTLFLKLFTSCLANNISSRLTMLQKTKLIYQIWRQTIIGIIANKVHKKLYKTVNIAIAFLAKVLYNK